MLSTMEGVGDATTWGSKLFGGGRRKRRQGDARLQEAGPAAGRGKRAFTCWC